MLQIASFPDESTDSGRDRASAAHTHASVGADGAGATYWPCELLHAFILQMAANGHCVNAAMMLGHRTYALAQIAAARCASDPALCDTAQRLQAFFDGAPACSGLPASVLSQRLSASQTASSPVEPATA